MRRRAHFLSQIDLHLIESRRLLVAIMEIGKFETVARSMRGIAVTSLALIAIGHSMQAQDAINSTKKPVPAQIDSHFLVIDDSVVREQWTHTLKLVNAPQNIVLLNPGQCIRVGIVSTGDGRDAYLEKTRLSFKVKFAGQSMDYPSAPLAQTKQMKTEGGDFVTAALAAGGIKNPLLTMASLGASADKWCVPADAQDGTAVVEAEAEAPDGHEKQARAKIQIESFETGSKRTFKDDQEFEEFLANYHYKPNPARLYPALQMLSANRKVLQSAGVFESISSSFSSALKENPVAEKDFMVRISKQSGFTRGFGVLAAYMAGYDIDSVLKTMSEEDQKMFKQHPDLPDPYDFSAPQRVPTEFDMLWGIFSITGQFAPIQKIATGLAWRPDWDDLEKALKSPHPPKEWTPSIGRAMAYSAAGWSLSSFQQNDPLAADYIEYMADSPDTPTAIKSELKGLSTNPAFKQKDGK
jgi:hypothetical protein